MSIPLLNEKLNTETARISWEELQPHFARGAAIYVAPDLDLIAVARHVAEDEAAPLKQWMEQGKFGAISDDMARTFLADKQEETFAKKSFPQQPKPKHRFSVVSVTSPSDSFAHSL